MQPPPPRPSMPKVHMHMYEVAQCVASERGDGRGSRVDVQLSRQEREKGGEKQARGRCVVLSLQYS